MLGIFPAEPADPNQLPPLHFSTGETNLAVCPVPEKKISAKEDLNEHSDDLSRGKPFKERNSAPPTARFGAGI
jgi:hypothetical protein